MLKFFQKYQKLILVVGGSLLMVVFLLPAGMSEMSQGDPRARVIGHVGDVEITSGMYELAGIELGVIEQIQREVYFQSQANQSYLANPLAQQFHPQIVQYPQDALAWVLIQEEARQQGIYYSSDAAMGMIELVQAMGVDVKGLLRSTRMMPEQFAATLQHVQMYLNLRNKIIGSGATSVPRLHHLAQDIGSRATISFAAIDPRLTLDKDYNPTDAEVAAQFDKYKADLEGQGDTYGFGYKLPDRVKIEYIGVPLKRVADSIQVDDVEANLFYLEHPERYMPTPTLETTPIPGIDTPEVETKPVVSGPEPYRAVRDRVMQDVRDRQADDQQTKIVAWIRRELDRQVAGQGLEVGDDGEVVFPAGYVAPSLEAVAQKAQAQFDLLPSVVRIDSRWMSLDDVRQMEGFGSASADISGRSASVVDIIRAANEFDPESTSGLVSLDMRVNATAPAVKDFAGDQYLFRLTDAEAEHVAPAVDEVKSTVVADLKALQSYNSLKEREGILLGRLKDEGLKAVAEGLKATTQPAGPFAKIDTTLTQYTGQLDLPWLPGIGQSEVVVDAVISRGRAIQELGGIDEVDAKEKFVVAAEDRGLKVCLIELTAYQPVDQGTYETMAQQQLPMYISMLAGQAQNVEDAEPPLSVDALIERLGYVRDTSLDEPEDEAGDDAAADADAAASE